jgi:hypothetical protein
MSLIIGLAACSKAVDDVPTDNTDNGEPTLMALKLSFPTSEQTRAGEETGLADESAIRTIDILIYGQNRILLDSKHFTSTDFTLQNGSYTATQLIQTTTGLKYVFAAANLPDNLLQSIKAARDVNTLTDDAYTIDRAAIAGADDDAFIMCSSKLTGQTLKSYTPTPEQEGVADPQLPRENRFDIQLIRMAAKVTVTEANNLSKVMHNGRLVGDLEFAIDHYNNKSYLIQRSAPDFIDPNWDETGWRTAPDGKTVTSIAESKYWDDLAKKTPGSDYLTVDASGTDFNSLAKTYVSENSSEPGILLKGTLTRLIVRATFLPGKVYETDAAATGFPVGYKEVDGPATATTFYKITNSAGQAFFTLNKNDVAGLSKAVGATTGAAEEIEYTDGKCYYSLWLNSHANAGAARYQTLRNQYYACTITGVHAIGSPREELDDLETPMIEPATDISVEIAVKTWDVVTNSYVLGE